MYEFLVEFASFDIAEFYGIAYNSDMTFETWLVLDQLSTTTRN